MGFRLPVLENGTRNHGVTLGAVAARLAAAPELQKASLVMRAQSYSYARRELSDARLVENGGLRLFEVGE